MFFPEQQVRVFLYGAPVEMRRSFDGLYAIARHGMQADPLAGHLFAFLNRRATQIKILTFDRSGWCVWARRLEQGRFFPGSYVILKYVRPVIKRRDTQALSCPAAPSGVLEGSRADVSFIAGLLVDKLCYHLPLYRQH